MAKHNKTTLEAINWLKNRNGDGGFDRNNVLLAGGDHAPFMRSTWNKLEESGFVEFYQNRRRIRLTDKGLSENTNGVSDRGAVEDHGSYGQSA